MMPIAIWPFGRRLRRIRVTRCVKYLLLPPVIILSAIFSIFTLNRFPLPSQNNMMMDPQEAPKQLEHPDDIDISPEIFHSPEIFKKDYEEMERQFKVFVYPDGNPETFYHTPLKLSGKYASEGYFFKNIGESRFLTSNPDEAHMFFIPISCQKMRAKALSYYSVMITVKSYVESLISKYPYWNRTLGADHFFVTCHEIGRKATRGVPDLMKNSILVMCSTIYSEGYIPHKDLALPQVALPFSFPAAGSDSKNRKVLASWARRNKMMNGWKDNNEPPIRKYQANEAVFRYSSKFCICSDGSHNDGPRLAHSIHYGCVPVIMSEQFGLPFVDILDWQKFSLTVSANDFYELSKTLGGIKDKQFIPLQNNTVKVQKHFKWNSPPIKYDAFHMLMYELWLRRHVYKL